MQGTEMQTQSCGFTDGAGDIPDVILQAGSHLLRDEWDRADLSRDEWISCVKSGMSEAGIDFAEWRWLGLKAGVDTAAMDDLDSWWQVRQGDEICRLPCLHPDFPAA
jgi:hypothetical protein